MNFILNSTVYYILNKLNDRGFLSYVVGGAVRDMILNKKIITDYDISTNATPDEVEEIFKEHKIIDIGKKYGTIKILIEDNFYEITSFRKEKIYGDNRHPSEVIFTENIDDDAKRRDFTINCIYMDKDKNIIDIYNGMSDINKKIIKTINNPYDRFNEDALRILRAIRFSAQLKFNIDEYTKKAIFNCKKLIHNISMERFKEEFNKIILCQNYKNILIEYGQIFDEIIDDFSKKMLLVCDMPLDISLRLAVIFSNYGLTKIINILKKLRYDNKTIKDVIFYINNKNINLLDDKIYIKKLMSKYDAENTKKLIIFLFFKNYIISPTKYLNIVHEITKNNECYKISQLKIKGYDILNKYPNFDRKKMNEILSKILDLVICGKIQNNLCRILNFIDECYYI